MFSLGLHHESWCGNFRKAIAYRIERPAFSKLISERFFNKLHDLLHKMQISQPLNTLADLFAPYFRTIGRTHVHCYFHYILVAIFIWASSFLFASLSALCPLLFSVFSSSLLLLRSACYPSCSSFSPHSHSLSPPLNHHHPYGLFDLVEHGSFKALIDQILLL